MKKLSKEMAYDMRTIHIKLSRIEDFRKKPQKDLKVAIVEVKKMEDEVLTLMQKVIKEIGENNEC